MELFEKGLVPPELINTSNCKKLGMRLKRFCEAKNAEVNFPNMVKLFEASNADKLVLLRNFLKNKENAEKCEMQLKYEKEVENTHKGTEKLLTIEGMRKEGVSEPLGSKIKNHVFERIYIYSFFDIT